MSYAAPRLPLVSHDATGCCGTTFTARSADRAMEMHAEYHNHQHSLGRRADRVEIVTDELCADDAWVGDLIRLAPATDTAPAYFTKITERVLHVRTVDLACADGTRLTLRRATPRTVTFEVRSA